VIALTGSGPAYALTGDIRMHDPSVIKVGTCYYGFSTGFENDPLNPSGSITIRKTCGGTAASGWTKVGNVWNPKVAAGGGDAYDDGTSKYFAYHYYDANNSGRETLDIRQITFTSGWPLMGPPLS
jgi:hypothetical protein